jgi:hypothetical protein
VLAPLVCLSMAVRCQLRKVQVVNDSELLVHSRFGDSKLLVYRQINSKVSVSQGLGQLVASFVVVVQSSEMLASQVWSSKVLALQGWVKAVRCQLRRFRAVRC